MCDTRACLGPPIVLGSIYIVMQNLVGIDAVVYDKPMGLLLARHA